MTRVRACAHHNVVSCGQRYAINALPVRACVNNQMKTNIQGLKPIVASHQGRLYCRSFALLLVRPNWFAVMLST